MTNFEGRLKRLRGELGGIAQVARKMGVSRETIYEGLRSPGTITAKTWTALAMVEADTLPKADSLSEAPPSALAEDQAAYDAALPVATERAQIEARFRALLDAAERVEGGLGWVRVQLGLHLDPSRLIALDASRVEGALERLRRLAAEANRGGGQTRKAG